MPSTTPSGARGPQPNAKHTTTTDPTTDKVDDLGVSKIKSRVIPNVNTDDWVSKALKVFPNMSIPTKQIQENSIMFEGRTLEGIPKKFLQKLSTCQSMPDPLRPNRLVAHLLC